MVFPKSLSQVQELRERGRRAKPNPTPSQSQSKPQGLGIPGSALGPWTCRHHHTPHPSKFVSWLLFNGVPDPQKLNLLVEREGWNAKQVHHVNSKPLVWQPTGTYSQLDLRRIPLDRSKAKALRRRTRSRSPGEKGGALPSPECIQP